MLIRDATSQDLPAITAIYNQAVETTTAVWTDRTATVEDRAAWLTGRAASGYPVLVAVDGERVVGFASFGDFRPWPGYRNTAELAIYVDQARQREGIGRQLLETLLLRASQLGKRVMIAGIEATNVASLALHRRAGFRDGGTLPAVGEKFGRSLDLVLLYLPLDP